MAKRTATKRTSGGRRKAAGQSPASMLKFRVHNANTRPSRTVVESPYAAREAILDECFAALRRVPSDLLAAWLPVLCEYAVDEVQCGPTPCGAG